VAVGYVHAEIEISNPKDGSLERLMATALVDTGALTLCIPEHVRLQLGLEEVEKREITTAKGRRSLVPYVGPVMVRFQNRTAFVGTLVLGDEVLLGTVPMEDMDLVVIPATRILAVNPQSPNYPQALVK
jgi:clan AA aspartic protease